MRVKKVLGVRETEAEPRELKAAPGQAIEMPEQGRSGPAATAGAKTDSQGRTQDIRRTAGSHASGASGGGAESEAGAAEVMGCSSCGNPDSARPWFSL